MMIITFCNKLIVYQFEIFYCLFKVILTSFIAGTSSQVTANQYALNTLIATRTAVANNLPAYTTLLKKIDVLIEATKAAIDPSCIAFQPVLDYF